MNKSIPIVIVIGIIILVAGIALSMNSDETGLSSIPDDSSENIETIENEEGTKYVVTLSDGIGAGDMP